jgi:MFS family permease
MRMDNQSEKPVTLAAVPRSLATGTNRIWTGSFVALLAVNVLLCFGFYMLPSTLPAYVKQLGGSNFEASLVIGLFSVMSLGSRVISGTIVDAAGERRVILAGIGVIVATTVAFVWAPIDAILLLRSVQGVGWGLATAAIATAVYKIVPESRRGEGSGYYALTVITAVSLSPLVAILLVSSFDFVVLLAVSASLTLASTVFLKVGVSTPPVPATDPGVRRKISLASIFERGALLPSALCFILSIPLCGVIAYLVLFGKEQQLPDVWVFFIGYALMILVTRPFIGRQLDRKGHVVIVLPGSLAMIAGLVALSVTKSTAMLVVSSLLYGLGYGAVQPTLHTWAVNRCPPDRKAAANGLFLSSIDLGYIVGAITLGVIAEWAGFAAMYRYSALAMFAFIALYLRELIRTARH